MAGLLLLLLSPETSVTSRVIRHTRPVSPLRWQEQHGGGRPGQADAGEHGDDSCPGARTSAHPLSHVSARKVWKERALLPHQVTTSGVSRTPRLRCPIWETSRSPLETHAEGAGPEPCSQDTPGLCTATALGPDQAEVQAAGWGHAVPSPPERQLDNQGE